ncbi:MAG: GTPase-activating protein [Vezdaea aestivalis]|nr:MAG: GTPase-activating protein [Vezdaea aestivalis]
MDDQPTKATVDPRIITDDKEKEALAIETPHTKPSTANSSGESSSSDDGVNEKDKASAGQDPTAKLDKLDSRIIMAPKKDKGNLDHLPESERKVIERQLFVPEVRVNFFTLFRYATKMDWVVIIISSACAIIGGALQPLMTIIFGQLTNSFTGFFQGSTTSDKLTHDISKFTLFFVYLAIGEYVTIYIATAGFIYTGEHITQKIRENYLSGILRQNIGFYDNIGAGEVTTRITADTNLVQDGLSEKIGLTMTALATFITAFVIGFIKSWKLTLILTSTVVAIVLDMGIGSTFIVKYSKMSLDAYGQGGTVVEEVISSIRNATAFGTQDKLARQYDVHLAIAEKFGRKMKTTLGIMVAGMFFVIYLNYGLSFWQGSRFLVNGDINVGSIITILLAIIIGAFALGNVAPNAQAFSTAVAAAAKIYNTIDRVSPLDPTSEDGHKLKEVEGHLELRHVDHIYPSRPEVRVMKDVNLVIPAGKTTALVGASGSGKSTIVGLVERFYDPVAGEVLLDGNNVADLNLKWLRSHLSLVSQEPTLFSSSVHDNIRYGLIGTPYENEPPEVQERMIRDAAKMANAHEFIEQLPGQYNMSVGERGSLLSGGQKQRIAIARAIVSNPKVLLLDEATSALDTKSEGVVQHALDEASKGRTTIVIAHRLSTIKHADNIVVMSRGRIVEQGTHDELLEKRAAYYNLVEAQKIVAANEAKQDEVEEDAEILEKIETKLSKTQSGKNSQIGQDPDDNIRDKLDRTQSQQSVSSKVLGNRASDSEVKYSLWTLVRFIASFNKSERKYLALGMIMALITGAGNPVQAIFFAKCISVLSLPPEFYGKLRHDVNFWAAMYLMWAWVQFIAFAVQESSFAYCSEKLIHRARDQAFRYILRQDIAFFDEDSNTSGALTSFLSTETTHLAGLSGITLGTLCTVTTTLASAIIISVIIGWKLGLVCTATIPILLLCGFFRFWMLSRFQQRAKKAYESSASYACEATNAIRTVASLTREKDVWNHYHESLNEQGRKSLISVLKSSHLYALSQSFMLLCIALGFWYGGSLIAKREYSLFQFFVCFTAVIFGAQSAGTIFSFAPDMGKAKQAATEVKKLFDRKPSIDTWSSDGDSCDHVDGTVEFRDVHFRYPTRPEQPVLRGLNLTVRPGEYAALVGSSGCGKSTTVSLLERFYDPLAGGIYIDGQEISSLNLVEYRKHLALVSQEPTLYQGSIRDNVLLGIDDDTVSDEAVIQACKEANIYDFIMSLPDGFSTIVGNKGSMLSGGQKQRVAIARALIRNPKVLLLDESTAALDSESEKVVQMALDKAAKGRTTIAVAHRLSTIQNADVIYVFDQGRIVEQGKHGELMAKKGRYYELVNLQSLGKTG